MSTQHPDAEQALEQATLDLFRELGWQTVNAYHETYTEAPEVSGGGPCLGRATRGEVILRPHVLDALAGLNPGLPPEAYQAAIEELTRDHSAMTLVRANREIYHLLKEGIPVIFRGPDGEERFERLQLVDWANPYNNDFLLVQQFWVSGPVYTRRADLVGFVNGLPLLFGELKAHHKRVEDAYRRNLSDYKDTIPHLLWYNALISLSNGSDARLGTVTGEWEHFNPWKKINHEGEEGVISLDTAIRGTCEPARFLDLVENYLIFQETRGGLAKIVAMYHQYLGVESALDAVLRIRENQGRLGVFWHTQGSGKSISMIFFCQKVLRRLPGNWTFVIITDRIDLDDQIYKNFSRAGVVTEPETRVRAQSGEHLKQLLQEDHRYIFTLIQKFGARGGERYPKLSDRADVIVITDEAHRSQYDTLAMNMRDALPNAAFLAFTATPLIVGEEKTRQVFGDYVSVYSYKQSNEDGSTVPLYYENRIPELELTNQGLNDQIYGRLEEAEVDDDQEAALAREFAREYHLITRDDRLEKIAEDIVDHFIHRGYLGKAMIVSIDKVTTVRMYDKVKKVWQRALQGLRTERDRLAAGEEREALDAKIRYIAGTDMAVVISQEQGEVQTFRERGIDILPHRIRMVNEDLDEKFKDPADPFRLVFVCAMWRTGFDVPCCSTIYLDRPMRNHTLMQTIARANRVFGEKVNGLIVDYVGIFRDLQRALAIYGAGPGGQIQEGEEPVEDKDALVERLREALAATEVFCSQRGVDLEPLMHSDSFQRIALMDDAVEKVIVNDQLKGQYLALAGTVDQLFQAILPDPRAGEFGPRRNVLLVLAAKIRALAPLADISDLVGPVEEVLDDSIVSKRYVIEGGEAYDLSRVDFEALQQQFEHGRKHTEAEKLRRTLGAKVGRMVRLNRSRIDYLEAFQRLIDEYNVGAHNVDQFFEQLIRFARQLDQEDQRRVAEDLTEEELAIFDLITRPKLDLTDWEKRQVKRVARELLSRLKTSKLVLDWRKRQQTRAAVRVTIEDWIWQLPDCFTDDMCRQKSALVYQHIYDNYWGAWSAKESVYALAA